jgi:RNA polymerase sigma factor (TIGR02999 family)
MSDESNPVENCTTADVTRLLNDAAAGHPVATQDLFQAVYDQLRQIARQRMAQERPDHTLQPTALVHEVYLRLVGRQPIHWPTRVHFFAAAAQAMRRILIEQARKRGRIKRGGGRPCLPMSVLDLTTEENPAEILALDEAIRRLEEQDARMAQVVRLRFFAGLSVQDTASALELSERTVKREWMFARAWLYRALAANPD